jgi:hypothetical protein
MNLATPEYMINYRGSIECPWFISKKVGGKHFFVRTLLGETTDRINEIKESIKNNNYKVDAVE